MWLNFNECQSLHACKRLLYLKRKSLHETTELVFIEGVLKYFQFPQSKFRNPKKQYG